MQKVRRERSSALPQLESRGLERPRERNHAALVRQPVPLQKVARRTGRDHIFPRRSPAPRPGNHVVEGQLVRREGTTAILTGEMIAQKNIKAREGGPMIGRHVLLQRDDARQSDHELRRANDPVVFGNDVHAIHENRLHRLLPGPERKRKVAERTKVGVQHQGRTMVGRRSQSPLPYTVPLAAPTVDPPTRRSGESDKLLCRTKQHHVFGVRRSSPFLHSRRVPSHSAPPPPQDAPSPPCS